MKKTLLALMLCGYGLLNAQVVINEYSASNVSFHTDDFGNFSDWVELYNPTAGPIDLSGYHLSDRTDRPMKFTIPAGAIIAANGYLRVYCNSRNQLGGTGNVHTNFKLTQTAPEVFLLADAAGAILQQVTLVPTQPNHSRGRTTDGAGTWSLFKTPSPGASNNTRPAYGNYTAKPSFSMAPGAYGATINVALTADAGSTIRYTTDGSLPTPFSPVYATPFNVSATTVIRALAINSDTLRPMSFVETNTYFINENHVLPLLSICGDQVDDLLDGNFLEPYTSMEYFDRAGIFRTEATGFSNEHGNDSWAYDQRGFDFIANDEYGINHGLTYKIFSRKDRDEFQRVIIKAAANDNYPASGGGAHIRDAYVHTLSHDADLNVDERTYEPCILYMNGQYWGVYEIREKVDDNDFTDHYYKQDEPFLYFLKTWGATWEEYGAPAALADWNALRAFINANTLTIDANYDYVDSLLNTKSIMDYFILNAYVVCADWLNWNTGWWRGINPDGDKKKWRYILWDMDATFGHYTNFTGIPNQGPGADPCDPEDLGDVGSQGHVPILDSLMQNAKFRQDYVNRYIDLNNTALSCDNMINLLDSLIQNITPEMPRQIAKWGGSYGGWQTNVTTLRNYIISRCDSITEGMKDCYNLTGPYTITFKTDPPEVADIKVNTITFAPSQLPYTGTYYGNIVSELKTTGVMPDYEFDHWEITSSPSPSADSSDITTVFNTPQTITAVYKIPSIFFIPTAFSPNGDGINDELKVMGKGIKAVNFDIYERWGQKVFGTTDYTIGWDGTFNGGQKCLPGVYAYRVFVEFLDGTSTSQQGNVTLMR